MMVWALSFFATVSMLEFGLILHLLRRKDLR